MVVACSCLSAFEGVGDDCEAEESEEGVIPYALCLLPLHSFIPLLTYIYLLVISFVPLSMEGQEGRNHRTGHDVTITYIKEHQVAPWDITRFLQCGNDSIAMIYGFTFKKINSTQ